MINIRPVAHIVGLLLCALSVAALATGAVELALTEEPDWRPFLTAGGIAAFCGLALVLATRPNGPIELNLRQAFLVTASCWLTVPLFAAGPFLLMGMSLADSVFEAVSGVTTTGSTVIAGLDGLPHGMLMWRAMLQWVGGVGIVVMAIVLLPFLRVGGMQLFRTESSERSEKILFSAFGLVAWIVSVYAALTLLCAVVYGMLGMSGFDAICHAMTTLSTGGYSTHDASFGHFANRSIQWAAAIFMLAGALPFIAYIKFVRGDLNALRRDPQVRSLLGFLALVIVALALWLTLADGRDLWTAMRAAAFNVVSIVTTTGFISEDYGSWGAAAVGVFFLLMFIGGCAGSTSGAIKIYRFQVLGAIVRTHLLRLMSPHRVTLPTYGGRRLPEELPVSVLAFLAAFLGFTALFTVMLAVMGLDLVTALTASATAMTNVGPGLGPVVGPAGNFASLPDGAKWLLVAAMLMGRLEVFTLLLMFDPQFWRG